MFSQTQAAKLNNFHCLKQVAELYNNFKAQAYLCINYAQIHILPFYKGVNYIVIVRPVKRKQQN